MLKDMIEFLVSYPLWVKIAVVVLAAGIGLLLVAFRPSGQPRPDASRVLKIERIESAHSYSRIRIEITANGKAHSFPETYEYAVFEPNMAGGEYRLTAADEFEIAIKIKTQTELTPPGQNTRTIFKELQLRQPIRLSAKDLPRQGAEVLRPVDFGAQGAPPDFNILLSYSLK